MWPALRTLRRALSGQTRSRPAPRRRPACRLRLEALENRVVPTITELGAPGSSFSDALAINASGQAVGSSFVPTGNGNSYFRAFLYSGGALTNLGTLGGTSSDASGINASGQVVGSSYTAPDVHGASYEHPFLYSGG